MAEDKIQARKKALKDRILCNQSKVSLLCQKEIIESNILDSFSTIGIYYPLGKEIDITGIMNHYKDKRFFLPKTEDVISFIEYKIGDSLIDGPFNTKEPIGNVVNRDLIECFIIPCVGVSKDKQRIGYGKGYYDRYLDGYEGFKIGVVYNNASNIDIKLDSFDLYLDMIITGE